MFSKDEFLARAYAVLPQYPQAALFAQAKDPRLLAPLEANAAMLAALSQQVELASFEPFLKARDVTVLADASLKGVLPLARPAQITITVSNDGQADYQMPDGTTVSDSKGRLYRTQSAVVVPARGSANVGISQGRIRTVVHVVQGSAPFYRIPVPSIDDDVPLKLAALSVEDDQGVFVYRPDYANVGLGERAWQAEVDETRELSICFGWSQVIGYQPPDGARITLTLTECDGRISDQSPNAVFTLDRLDTAADAQIRMALVSVGDEGQDPPSLPILRTLARYPALYDHNAVYLGNFDFLLRRYLSPIRFLSVWNEQVEEIARGPNLDSVNKLFVAGMVDGMSDAAFQDRVTELIKRADDSYRTVFKAVDSQPVPVTVTARVAVVHDLAAVRAQIRGVLLEKYGSGSPDVAAGLSNPIRFQAVYGLLKSKVDALKDPVSDFTLSVTLPDPLLPEMFVHISDASLTVSVTHQSHSTGLWNY